MRNLTKLLLLVIALASFLGATNSVTIGHTMYQRQKFDYMKDVLIFASDREGRRVWNWQHAQRYCRNLTLGGYRDWQVASKAELLKIMSKHHWYNWLYVKKIYGGQYMPEPDPKYHNVWMWTRDSNGNLGAFVNFKKGNYGWADKKYKGYVICTRAARERKKVSKTSGAKQELSHSHSWVKAYYTCSGYTALKKDGTLWQFGKVGDCDYGQITPIDPDTGKPLYTSRYKYYLRAQKIGSGFRGAKFITNNGGDNMYAIKRDGTLWGWGKIFGKKAKKLSSARWADFATVDAGNGCCNFDVGLKRDGTLWGYKEGFRASNAKLRKLSPYKWKKILIECCTIYGLRSDNTLWEKDQPNGVFKRYKKNKRDYALSKREKGLLDRKMAGVKRKMIYPKYGPRERLKIVKAKRDGTLYLDPIKVGSY